MLAAMTRKWLLKMDYPKQALSIHMELTRLHIIDAVNAVVETVVTKFTKFAYLRVLYGDFGEVEYTYVDKSAADARAEFDS